MKKIWQYNRRLIFMESLQVLTFLKDIYALKKPFVTEFHGRKNEVLPFEDIIPIESMCKKNDASLFLFGNHNQSFHFSDVVISYREKKDSLV